MVSVVRLSMESSFPPLDTEGDYISIRPLLAAANHPPIPLPASLGARDGLGDIAEGAEEEETEHESTTSPTEATAATVTKDPDFITPSQIQGLRISTSPVLPLSSFGTPPILSSCRQSHLYLHILPLGPTALLSPLLVIAPLNLRISPPPACIVRRARTHEQVRSPPSDPSKGQNPLVIYQLHGVRLLQVPEVLVLEALVEAQARNMLDLPLVVMPVIATDMLAMAIAYLDIHYL